MSRVRDRIITAYGDLKELVLHLEHHILKDDISYNRLLDMGTLFFFVFIPVIGIKDYGLSLATILILVLALPFARISIWLSINVMGRLFDLYIKYVVYHWFKEFETSHSFNLRIYTYSLFPGIISSFFPELYWFSFAASAIVLNYCLQIKYHFPKHIAIIAVVVFELAWISISTLIGSM